MLLDYINIIGAILGGGGLGSLITTIINRNKIRAETDVTVAQKALDYATSLRADVITLKSEIEIIIIENKKLISLVSELHADLKIYKHALRLADKGGDTFIKNLLQELPSDTVNKN